MTTPTIPIPPDVRARNKTWVIGIVSAIAGAIGWNATLKAIDVGLAYYRENPLPAKEARAVIATNAVEQPVPVSNIAFTIHKPRKDYVAWTGCDRKGWPEKTVKGRVCNGMLKVNGKEREWIPVGRENTGLRNFLPGGDFAQNIRKGDVLRFEVCDIHGKLRNPAYVGEDTYR